MPSVFKRRTSIVTSGFTASVLVLRPSALSSAAAATSILVDPQPYFAGVKRVLEALAKLGAPANDSDARQLTELAHRSDDEAVRAAEEILARYTLARVVIEAEGYARATEGEAQRTLI